MSSFNNQMDSAKMQDEELRNINQQENVTEDTPKIDNNMLPFVERWHLNLDDLEYERGGNNPGKLIIFNQEYFDINYATRHGTQRDVNDIITCFQRLGYNIHENDILHDSTVEEVRAKINSVLEEKEILAKSNSLIIFFLTHGETENRLAVKDGLIDGREIWSRFITCPELERKPKMFFFQACKGKYYSTTHGTTSVDNLHPEPSQLLPLEAFTATGLGIDMLLVFSTIEGNVSLRNRTDGTWFIQELCRNISSYGRRDDVISLITRTIKCISGNYYEEGSQPIKQMPVFLTTLSKKCYLNRNKDRHLLLEINKKLDKIIYELLESKRDSTNTLLTL